MVRTRMRTAGIFFCLVTLSLITPSFYKQLTHSFHIERFRCDLPPPCIKQTQNNIDSSQNAEITTLLSQPFTYLARGAQAFVFASADKQYVLKLFLCDTPSSSHVLESCAIAKRLAENETGLVYTHLIPTHNTLPEVYLKGPLFKRSRLALDQFRFVIQKRATPLSEKLIEHYRANDFESFYQKIEQVFSFLKHRNELGIYNSDPRPISNFGFIDSDPVEIDFGQYSYSSHKEEGGSKERDKAWNDLIQWMKQKTPEWQNLVEERISRSPCSG